MKDFISYLNNKNTIVATLFFVSLLILTVSVVIGSSAMLRYLPEYISAVKHFFTHCDSLKLLWLTTLPLLRVLFPWGAVSILLVGFAIATCKGIRRQHRNRRFLRQLVRVGLDRSPGLEAMIEAIGLRNRVFLFKSNKMFSAFTSGLWRSRIYLSTGLISHLSNDELRAVILHEKYHLEHRSPLRLFVISFLKDWLFFLPVCQYFVSLFQEGQEEVADDRVVNVSGDSISLARTLLKVTKLTLAELPIGVGISVRGTSPVEWRIKRLLGSRMQKSSPALTGKVCLSLLIAIFIFVPFFGRVSSSSGEVLLKFSGFIRQVCIQHGEHKEAGEDNHSGGTSH